MGAAGRAVLSVGRALIVPETRRHFLGALGWTMPPGVDDLDLSAIDPSDVIDKLTILTESTDDDRADTLLMAGRIADLATAIATFIEALDSVVVAFDTFPPNYLQVTGIKDQFVSRLVRLVFVRVIGLESPLALGLLRLADVVRVTDVDEDPSLFQSQHQQFDFNFDRLAALVSPSRSWAQEAYGWKTASPDLVRLIKNISFSLQSFGVHSGQGTMSRRLEELVLQRSVPEADTDPMPALTSTLFRAIAPDTAKGGVAVFGLRASSPGATDAGLGITPTFSGTGDLEVPLFLSDKIDWRAVLFAEASQESHPERASPPGVTATRSPGRNGE
jgi:hypothetical protein